MASLFRKIAASVSVLSLLAVAAVSSAQTEGAGQGTRAQPGVRTQQPGAPGAPGQQAMHIDAELASWLIADNKTEVALAKFAQSRLQNEAVVEFNNMLIKEHTDLINRLEQMFPTVKVPEPVAIGGPRTQGGQGGQEGQQGQRGQTGAGAQGQRAPQAAHGQGVQQAGLNWLQVHSEILNNLLGTAQTQIESFQGRRLDEAYLGMQAGCHVRMIAELKAFRNHASPQFQPVLDQALAATQKHLEKSKSLMEQVGQAAGEQARKPRTGTRNQ